MNRLGSISHWTGSNRATGAKPVAFEARKKRTNTSRDWPHRRLCHDSYGSCRLIDVIAEGLPIDRGQAVIVTKSRGNRVMVHAADA